MKKMLLMSSVLSSILMASSAFAGVVYQYNSSGQYGQAGNGSTGMELTVDGSGVNEVARLVYYSYAGGSFSMWAGDIPTDAVTVNGVNSMSVQLDTCTVNNVDGCGYVDVTIDTNEPAAGWVYTGAYNSQYGNMVIERVGHIQARFSTAVGTVNGISVDGRGFIGKMTDVNVTVSLP